METKLQKKYEIIEQLKKLLENDLIIYWLEEDTKNRYLIFLEA